MPEPRSQKPLVKDSRDVIEKLLKRDTSERLGCMKLGTEGVKKEPFFSKLNWHRLEKKLIQPPYVPTLSDNDPVDVTNFDCDDLSTPRNDHKSASHAGNAYMFEDF